jgi:hypothetical protein
VVFESLNGLYVFCIVVFEQLNQIDFRLLKTDQSERYVLSKEILNVEIALHDQADKMTTP